MDWYRKVDVLSWLGLCPSGPSIPGWRLLLNSRRWSALSGTSLLVALAQSLCTAVLTISGVRVAIGLSALAAASGIYAPAKGFHQDVIRIPMLILAAVGAIVNLGVLAWIWHLRSRPAGQWRRRELSSKEKRSEKLQLGMAILTLVLVGLETWTHSMVHRTGPAPASVTQRIGTQARRFSAPPVKSFATWSGF